MTTRSFKIEKLYIEHFRGLWKRLELDLRSPITLLFAVNGTGKTSVCDAAEWLLTGQVERLRQSQRFDSEILSSKFSETIGVPKVSASISQKQQFYLSRTPAGTTIDEGDVTTHVGLNELLERLAPQAADPRNHHITAINQRQNWLRGTHFLSIEALAALVDTDEGTIERRKQIFSDLLGIRHLLDASREVERYRDVITAAKSRVGIEIEESSGRISALDAFLKSAGNQEQSLRTLLGEIEIALYGDPPTKSEDQLDQIAGRIERFSVDHARRSEEHGRSERSIALLEARWPDLHALNDNLKSELTNETNMKTDQKKSFGRLQELADQVSGLEKQLTDNENRRKQVEQALNDIDDAADELERAAKADDTWPNLTLKAAESAIPESMFGEKRRADQYRTVSNLIERSIAFSRARSEINDLSNEQAALRSKQISATEWRELRRELAAARKAASAADAELDSIRDPIERLKSAGSELMAHYSHGSEATCPLCGHDWVSTSRLRSAIDKILKASPAVIRSMTKTATDAATRLKRLQERDEIAVSRRQQIENLEARIAKTKEQVDDFETRMRSLHLDPHVRNVRAVLESRLERLALAAALDGLKAVRETWAAVLKSALLNEREVDSWTIRQVRKDAVGRIRVALNEIKKRTEVIGKKIAEARTSESEERRKYHERQNRLNGCATKIASIRADLAGLQKQWESVSTGEILTKENIDFVRRRIDDQTTKLNELAEKLAVARSLYEQETRIAEFNLEKKRNERSIKRQEQLERLVVTADECSQSIKSHYRDKTRRQIETLGAVVNALFSRMHANRVVDRIDLGADEDFLRWFGDAGGEKLDPQTEFSQGQRQDLAIAIFLARVHELGGTFFLDEPMMHLDDINRVALLDVLRAIAIECQSKMNLVITTANRNFARHMIEKFSRIRASRMGEEVIPLLRVIELVGNARTGVTASSVFPTEKSIAAA